MRFLIVLLMLCALIAPIPVLAEGENDPLWNTPTYEKKIFEVGQRLLQANGIQEKIAFRLDRSNDLVNASADRFSGNIITIGKGYLNFFQSDDDLAAVLGHEIAHITRRHHRKAAVKRKALALGLATLIVAASGEDDYDDFSGLSRRKRNTSNDSREEPEGPHFGFLLNASQQKYETEADLVGIDFMVHAGYNPLSMERVQFIGSGDRPLIAGVLSTHPSGSKRIEDIRQHIASHYPQFLTTQTASLQSKPAPPKENTVVMLSNEAQVSTFTSERATPNVPLSKILLELEPQQLQFIKWLSKQEYVQESRLQESGLDNFTPEYLQSVLATLQKKQLLRVIGSEPDRIFVLSDWAAKELQQAKP